MFRRATALIMCCLAIAFSTPVGAQTPAPAPAAWVDEAVPGLLHEIALLNAAGALKAEPSLAFITGYVGIAGSVDVFAELVDVDSANSSLLAELDPAGAGPISSEVRRSMSKLPPTTTARILDGDRAFVDSQIAVRAAIDLIARHGGAPEERQVGDSRLVVEALRYVQITGVEFSELRTDATFQTIMDQLPASSPPRPRPEPSNIAQPIDSTQVANPEDTPDTRPIIAIIGSGIAGVVIGTVALIRRRRSKSKTSPSADVMARVLEATRRMTAATSEAEVRAIAVEESMQMADADAASVAVPHSSGATLASASSLGVFAAGHVVGGFVSRVLETGQSARLVVDTDPSLTNPPLAVAAVPVIAAGEVCGAIIVTRSAHDAFTTRDLTSLELLAPVTGTALRAASDHHSLTKAADVDSMTHLRNRRGLDHDLAGLEDPTESCFAMIDVDHFKSFNDAFGHPAGDDALHVVAQTIEASVRETDTVYRYGGEEFSVLLARCGIEEAESVLERVRIAVSQTELTAPDGTSQRLTVSVGVANLVHGDAADLPSLADEALYAAKGAGRDRVVTAISGSEQG